VIVDRVKALEVYVTVSAAGITYYPKDGFPKWENFPYVEIAELHGQTYESLGASEGWQADPYGVPAEPKYVTFTAEGPDAVVAIEVIKDVLSKPPPASKLGTAATSFRGMWKYLYGAPATEGQRYRPSGYRPAGVDNKLSEKADRMEREREEIRKRWERRGGVFGRRGT
jgi:hypothetical protein